MTARKTATRKTASKKTSSPSIQTIDKPRHLSSSRLSNGKIERAVTLYDCLADYREEFLNSPKDFQEYVLVFAHGKLYKDCPRSALVVRKSKDTMHADLYNLPGGKVNPNEAPADAALRKLKEETGQIGSFPQLIGGIVPADSSTHANYLVWIYRTVLAGEQPQLSWPPGQPASWQPIENAVNGDFVPNLSIILALSASSFSGFLMQDTYWDVLAMCSRDPALSQAMITVFPQVGGPKKKERFTT